jgi:hypothetical protein
MTLLPGTEKGLLVRPNATLLHCGIMVPLMMRNYRLGLDIRFACCGKWEI